VDLSDVIRDQRKLGKSAAQLQSDIELIQAVKSVPELDSFRNFVNSLIDERIADVLSAVDVKKEADLQQLTDINVAGTINRFGTVSCDEIAHQIELDINKFRCYVPESKNEALEFFSDAKKEAWADAIDIVFDARIKREMVETILNILVRKGTLAKCIVQKGSKNMVLYWIDTE
jgi:hypothetical protein